MSQVSRVVFAIVQMVKKFQNGQKGAHSASEWVTRAPIELFWAAEKWTLDFDSNMKVVFIWKMDFRC